jgi:hypothetical protein
MFSLDRFHPSAVGYKRTAKALLPSLLAALGVRHEVPFGHQAPPKLTKAAGELAGGIAGEIADEVAGAARRTARRTVRLTSSRVRAGRTPLDRRPARPERSS